MNDLMIMKEVYDDIEEYKVLCKRFGEEIQYSLDHYGHVLEDPYKNRHLNKLKERRDNEKGL